MQNKARAARGEDRFGAGRGQKWEWGGATRWSLRRRLRMEGLREGRKEREREQRVPKQSRRQQEERERWRAREEETFPVELMLWGHFLFFS